MNKKNLLDKLNYLLIDNPYILLDDSISIESLNNNVQEISNGEIVWEDMSDDDIDIADASEKDIEFLIEELEYQLYKDDMLMERCRGNR